MTKTKLIILLLFLSPFFIYSSHFSKSLWLHSGMFSKNKKEAITELNEKLTFYKEIGVENLYIFKTLKKEHKKGWDFLKDILKIAHKNKLKVHPIITSGHRVRVEGKIKKNPDWLIKDVFGRTLPYLNLSNPYVRKYIQNQIKKLLKYNIDGIHLDYIRFPYLSRKEPFNSVMSILIRIIRTTLNQYIPENIYYSVADNYFSYDRKTLKLFNDHYLKNLIPPPLGGLGAGEENQVTGDRQQETLNEYQDDQETEDGSHVIKQWIKWNASNVTLLVKNIREQIKRSGKNIPLSAAIFSNKKFALNSLGQDWGKWGRSGMVDVLCPMLYTNDIKWFKERLQNVIKTVNGKCKVYAGIAIVSSHNKNTLKGVSDQIKAAKELKANGIILFSGKSLTEEYGEIIKGKYK